MLQIIICFFCNVQRLALPLNVHAFNIHIFSLVHQLRLLLIFNFDACRASCKFTTYSCLHLCQK